MSERMTAKPWIVVAGRDPIGTGGGKVLIETVRYFLAHGHRVHVISDVDLSSVFPDVCQHVMPLGGKLKAWAPNTKLLKVIRHLLQLVLFSIYGRYWLAKYERQGWISIDHNLEAFGGHITVFHNVFIEEIVVSQRTMRLLNPVCLFRLIREKIVFSRQNILAVAAVSQRALNEVRKHYAPNVPLFFIPNGVDINKFSPMSIDRCFIFRKQHGFFQDDFLMLFVGHEFKRKGLDFILDAMVQLPSNYKLIVIGGRSENMGKYRKKVLSLNIQERVLFLGTRYDIELYYAACDVFVFPSAYETFALVVIEAMACGCVVLTSKVGGVEDYLVDGVNGFFIERSSLSIAENIMKLERDKKKLELIRRAARKTAQDYSWENCAERYLRVINSIQDKMDNAENWGN